MTQGGPAVLFDGRIFQLQHAGGINRYCCKLISALPNDWEPVVSGVYSLGLHEAHHPQLTVTTPPDFRPRRFKPFIRDWWWKPRMLRRVSLVHPTYYELTCGFSYKDFKCPVVVTVHDMTYALFPEQMNGPEVVKAQANSVRRADIVVCVSAATERDLLHLIPEAKGKTEVIHHGCSYEQIENNTPDDMIFENPYFLYVGHRAGYKNFAFLLRAFAKASSVNPRITLQVAGPPLSPQERWDIFFLGISNRVICHEYPDEATLKGLYQRSVAMLYPSIYEGFGFPALEAMACGTVAVTSNTSSLPEIVGQGGISLDPSNEDLWIDWMHILAAPFAKRKELLQLGKDQLNKFSWQGSMDAHLNTYRKLIG